jgi:hypothetical protein
MSKMNFYAIIILFISTFAYTNDVQMGGYGELHFNKPTKGLTPQNSTGTLDFHRFVLNFNYQFSDWIWFNSELELEHTLIEGGEETGELSIEQAFINLQYFPAFGLRAGIMLVPMGIVNLRHEPPTFHGVERPNVEKTIIPSTWREAGFGIAGILRQRLKYQAYLMAGLDPDGLDGKNGIRGARQKGFKSSTQDYAFTGRLEYIKSLNTTIGGGIFFSTLEKSAEYGDTLKGANIFIGELHSIYRWKNLQFKALFVYSSTAETNKLNTLYADSTSMPGIGSEQIGAYGEIAYDFLGHIYVETEQRLFVFCRYEFYDTQFGTEGFPANPAYERREITVGLTYLPIINVSIKTDYQYLNTSNSNNLRQFNIGIGYNF